jgi:hypothetical protein
MIFSTGGGEPFVILHLKDTGGYIAGRNFGRLSVTAEYDAINKFGIGEKGKVVARCKVAVSRARHHLNRVKTSALNQIPTLDFPIQDVMYIIKRDVSRRKIFLRMDRYNKGIWLC